MKQHELKQTDLDRLLNWLDPHPEQAGRAYEKIRWRLITILASRGCPIPEELADEVIDRVARRVGDIQETYRGDKGIYFLGVMNNVHHEYLKQPRLIQPPETDSQVEIKERAGFCLDKCLERLAAGSRQMIERYYSQDKGAKINIRKQMAAEMGITGSTLRLRALRVREKLQRCIEQCLEQVESTSSHNHQPVILSRHG